MKTKIKEVQNYFKSKLINGDFEVSEGNYSWIRVIVDKDYTFTVYIPSIHEMCSQFNPTGEDFMVLDISDDEGKAMYNKFYKIHEWITIKLIERKEIELNQLKSMI
jgi:hypothetical protein